MKYTRSQKFIYTIFLICAAAVFGDVQQWDKSTYPKKVQEQLDEAQQAFKKKKFAEALRLYQTIGNNVPTFLTAHIGEGDSAAKLGNYPIAIDAFQRAIKLISEMNYAKRISFEPTVQAKLATAYHRNKQLDEADTLFQQAIKGAGESTPVTWYIALAQIETERGNLEKARRYYIVAVQLYPDTPAAFNNLGHVLLKLNRIDEADAVFRQALILNKTLASAAYGRGEVAAKRKQFLVAKRFFEQVIQQSPNEPIFHKSLADVLDQLKDTGEAKRARSRYKQTLAEVYRRQAHEYIEKQQGEPALALLTKALEVDAAYIPALKDYAYVKMQMKELVAAKQTYLRVLELEPTSRQALLHLGRIAAQFGNKGEAESHYIKLIQHEPDFMETYSQLAKLRETSNNLDGAENALTMGIQHQPTWAPGYWWRGQIYQKLGNSTKAEADFRRAIQLAPDVPFPKDALAALLANENRSLDEAQTLAESAIAIDNRPTHIATLALVYYRLNRTTDAQREIRKAFSQNPKNPYVLQIRSEILQIDK